MSNDRNSRGGPSLANMLTVLFVALKLTGQIDWSWFWVTCPFWTAVILSVLVDKAEE